MHTAPPLVSALAHEAAPSHGNAGSEEMKGRLRCSFPLSYTFCRASSLHRRCWSVTGDVNLMSCLNSITCRRMDWCYTCPCLSTWSSPGPLTSPSCSHRHARGCRWAHTFGFCSISAATRHGSSAPRPFFAERLVWVCAFRQATTAQNLHKLHWMPKPLLPFPLRLWWANGDVEDGWLSTTAYTWLQKSDSAWQ